MKGLVLAGGHGTRLRPLTFSGNKHMLPIANEPMLFYGLRHLAAAGISEVGIILGPLHEGIREAVGNGESLGLQVSYIYQGDPKGLAHAVLCAREFLGDSPFVMYLGDNLLQEGVAPFLRRFEADPADAVVGVTPVPRPSSYGVVELDGDRILSIVEKPAAPRSDLALIGVYLFSPSIHPIIEKLSPSARGELEITDAIWQLHHSGRRVLVQRVDGWWKDTGRPEDLLEANDLVLRTRPPSYFQNLGHISPGAEVKGAVRIGPGSHVDSGSRIEGPVVIGSDVRIHRGARIGPGTSIGDRCVLSVCSVERALVMEGAEIRGGVDITDSIIGRDARIAARGDARVGLSCTLGDATQLRV